MDTADLVGFAGIVDAVNGNVDECCCCSRRFGSGGWSRSSCSCS